MNLIVLMNYTRIKLLNIQMKKSKYLNLKYGE